MPPACQALGVASVFLSGLLAGVYGVFLLVVDHREPFALALALGGLSLVAWVVYHPARRDVPEAEHQHDS